jgi:hypothetical protein
MKRIPWTLVVFAVAMCAVARRALPFIATDVAILALALSLTLLGYRPVSFGHAAYFDRRHTRPSS